MLNGSGNLADATVGILMEFDETWMGGVNYIINLLKTLKRLPAEEAPCIVVIASENAASLLTGDLDDFPVMKIIYLTEQKLVRLIPGRFRPYGHGVDRLLKLNNIIRKNGIELLFPVTVTRDLMMPTRTVGWIPDLQHKFLPEFFTKEEVAKRDAIFDRFARRASCMIFSSRSAKQDFERFYPYHKDKGKNFVYSFCTVLDKTCNIKSAEYLRDKYGLNGSFLYLPNQFWAHKNHLLVFKTLARLQQEGYKITMACTGSSHEHRNREYYNRLMSFKEDNCLENIKILGLVPREDQYSLYFHATAVLQPSLFEGWSSIVEDARAFGKPMILSDIPVHREQNPPATVFFRPLAGR